MALMEPQDRDHTYPLGSSPINTIAMITNPRAGHGSSQAASQRASRVFAERGIDVISLQGSNPDDARHLIREVLADGRIDALVACGGDGMINLALQEQAGTGIPLGIIPAGTGNDHAREYNLPRDNAKEAAHIVADGFWTTTDLGKITDSTGAEKWFGTIMCAGFDSVVSDRVNQMKWPHGRNRYNLAILREFLAFQPLDFRITLDDDRVLDDPITLAAFGNTRSYGGGMKICPKANHSDGLFDVTVIGKGSRLKVAMSFKSVFDGTLEELPEVTTYRCRSAHVECTGPRSEMNAYADGDFMFAMPVTAEIVPAVGKYIVPRP